MKKIKKLLFSIVFLGVILLILQVKSNASYSIDNMDIQSTILENGDVNIKQSIMYNFNGSYNGIYINIPYIIDDIEKDEIISNNRINDNLYTGKDVVINKITDNKSKQYFKTTYATNGTSGVYTVKKEEGIINIKVYSPSNNEEKKFILDYTIKNLCVKHNDIGELYYNFIGGEWDVAIQNLNIDIYLPKNKGQIYIWGHGPLEGISSIVSNQRANFKVTNVGKGQYVAARVIFNNQNIVNSTKLSNINAKDIIFEDEELISENKEEKRNFTQKVMLFAVGLIIYWFILLAIFEKEKKCEISYIDEDELFKKYNPMIAGVIQDNRDILARDIIATLLSLIDKKYIQLEIVPFLYGKDDKYIYYLSKNSNTEKEMDEVERYVYNWFFEKNVLKADLQKRLEEMPKEKVANERFKTLNEIVRKNVNALGANKAKVPIYLRVLNWGLLVIAVMMIVKHIIFNGFDVYVNNSTLLIMMGNMLPYLLYFIVIFGYIPISILIMVRHGVNNVVQKITGKKVVTTTVSIILIFAVIMILTAIFSPVKYIMIDELLLCVAIIIILTDNLMLKNNDEILEDYTRLNMVKDKIEQYTLIDEKDVEHVTLWDKYLCYAVSFGIGEKMIKRLKGLYLDEDLSKIMEDKNISKLVMNDYYLFYKHASLDRRFLRSYGKMIQKVGSSRGSSSGRGGGFSGGGRSFSGGGGRGGGGGAF